MSNAKCLTNAQIFTEFSVIEQGWLIIKDGVISDFGKGEAPGNRVRSFQDCTGLYILPGFVDLHIHGAAGHEMMDATPAALRAIAKHCARHGVTGFLPTTWSASDRAIRLALENASKVMCEGTGTSQVLGAHIEGPYLNPQFAGAQHRQQIRPIDMVETKQWLEKGNVHLLSLAPESPSALRLIRHCAEHGIATSAAHSGASLEQMKKAIQAGLRQVTHTFNAMPQLHHREPGILGAALTMTELGCEIIADGIHVHPGIVNLLYRLKGSEKLILISDSVRGAGMPENSEYVQDGRLVRCEKGAARLQDGTLAGSILTMDKALRNLQRFTGGALADLWPCASLTPARAIGLDEKLGSITKGKRADLVLLTHDGYIKETIVAGKTVFHSHTV